MPKAKKLFKLLLYIKTILKLGIINVSYVAWYRFSMKSGLRKHFFPFKKLMFTNDFYQKCQVRNDYPLVWKKQLIEDAERITYSEIRYFAYHWKNLGNPPDWFLNPFNNQTYPNANFHWTFLPDFQPVIGDIKTIWEASRYEWAVTLSRAYAVTSNIKYLETLNKLIRNWAEKNPLNEGPNWKCGQEASIRIFNLLNSALILGQAHTPSSQLCDFIYSHLERINSNILYAIAQDNNHGTSEATALFIGGNWLQSSSANYPNAAAFATNGKKWLENRINKLVEDDGSFSQHSVTYHRVMLDTLIFAEFWRQHLNLPSFSNNFYNKAKAAIKWLWLFTDEDSGDCPNLGSNDGALLLNLHSCGYRNFRPTLQTALALFSNTIYYIKGDYDEPLYWFGKQSNYILKEESIRISSLLNSGYIIIKSSNSWSLLRFPFFRFRPSHNDVFHFDLWYKGINVIPDSGTYSYNSPASEKTNDFKSVHFHNTVSFDKKEQMPKLGNFLLGNWLNSEYISEIKQNVEGGQEWSGSYLDNQGNRHIRKIRVREDTWQISDTLTGNFNKAGIGFNIADTNCSLVGNRLNTNFGEVIIPENAVVVLGDSFSSSCYMEKHPIKRLFITILKPGTYTTTIILKS